MLQGPSRGLCSAQTSGSPMTLFSAPAAGSASKADVNLECVETGQASGSARDTAPALEAPSNAISNPNSKQTQHGNDRRIYFPDLLRAACHYCDHLPGDTQLPITPDGRLSVPEYEAEVLLQDLHNNRAPKGLVLRRKGRTRNVSPGAAYLARRTLALLRDAIDLDTARSAWQSRLLPLICRPPDIVELDFDNMELRESARDILLQRSTASRRAAPEWEEAQSCFVGRQSYEAVAAWLDDATAWQMGSRQIHGTRQLPSDGLFAATDPPIETRFRTRKRRCLGGGGGI